VTPNTPSTWPDWLSFDEEFGYLFSVVPTSLTTRTFTFDLIVTDGAASVGETFTIEINRAVEMTKTFASDYSDSNGKIIVSCSDFFTFNLKDYFSDPDDDTLSYSVTRFNGSALPSWLGVSSEYVLSGTPGTNQGEILNMLVSVTDNRGSTLNVPLEFFVGCPPKDMGRMEDILYLTSGQEFKYNFIYSFEDYNGQPITYKFNGPSWIGISGTIMTGRPTDPGTYYGTLSVCDRFAVCLEKDL